MDKIECQRSTKHSSKHQRRSLPENSKIHQNKDKTSDSDTSVNSKKAFDETLKHFISEKNYESDTSCQRTENHRKRKNSNDSAQNGNMTQHPTSSKYKNDLGNKKIQSSVKIAKKKDNGSDITSIDLLEFSKSRKKTQHHSLNTVCSDQDIVKHDQVSGKSSIQNNFSLINHNDSESPENKSESSSSHLCNSETDVDNDHRSRARIRGKATKNKTKTSDKLSKQIEKIRTKGRKGTTYNTKSNLKLCQDMTSPSGNPKQCHNTPPHGNPKQRCDKTPPSGNSKQRCDKTPLSGKTKQRVKTPPSGNLKHCDKTPPSGNPKQHDKTPPSGNLKQRDKTPPSGNPKQCHKTPPHGNPRQRCDKTPPSGKTKQCDKTPQSSNRKQRFDKTPPSGNPKQHCDKAPPSGKVKRSPSNKTSPHGNRKLCSDKSPPHGNSKLSTGKTPPRGKAKGSPGKITNNANKNEFQTKSKSDNLNFDLVNATNNRCETEQTSPESKGEKKVPLKNHRNKNKSKRKAKDNDCKALLADNGSKQSCISKTKNCKNHNSDNSSDANDSNDSINVRIKKARLSSDIIENGHSDQNNSKNKLGKRKPILNESVMTKKVKLDSPRTLNPKDEKVPFDSPRTLNPKDKKVKLDSPRTLNPKDEKVPLDSPRALNPKDEYWLDKLEKLKNDDSGMFDSCEKKQSKARTRTKQEIKAANNKTKNVSRQQIKQSLSKQKCPSSSSLEEQNAISKILKVNSKNKLKIDLGIPSANVSEYGCQDQQEIDNEERSSSFSAFSETFSDKSCYSQSSFDPNLANDSCDSLSKLNESYDTLDDADDDSDGDLPEFLPQTNDLTYSPKENDIVWTKCKKYPFWPSKILKVLKIKKKTKLKLWFLGSNESFIFPFKKNCVLPYSHSEKDNFITHGKNQSNKELVEQFNTALNKVTSELIKSAPIIMNSNPNENSFFSSDLEEEESLFQSIQDEFQSDFLSTRPKSRTRCLSLDSKVTQKMMESCERRKAKVVERNKILVEFIKTDQVKTYLCGIYNRQIESDLHIKFHSSATEQNHLRHTASSFGYLENEEQIDEVFNILSSYYNDVTGGRSDSIDYIVDVWFPEAVVYSLMKVKKYTKNKAWEMFEKPKKLTKAEEILAHQQMIKSSSLNKLARLRPPPKPTR